MLKKIIIIIIILIILAGFTAWFLITDNQPTTLVNVNLPASEALTNINSDVSPAVNGQSQSPKPAPTPSANNNTVQPTQIVIPSKLELPVAFAPQAPFANWDELHQEACEEASIITVGRYFSSQPLNEKIMDEEIYKLDDWERAQGYKIDLTAAETAQVLKDYYQLQAKVVVDVSVDRIKYELSRGNLIIVPLAGRALKNPYFRTPGPIYHMLVIRGYDNDEFITNEVGTKRGDGFKYKYDQLIKAVHDWESSWSHYEVTDEQMIAQPKRMVIVDKL